MTVQNTNEVLIFLARFSNAIVESLEDGKVTITDITTIFKPLISAKDAFNDIDQVPLELGELDSEEATLLVQTFKDELDLEVDNLEEVVEEGLALAVAIVRFVNKIREAKNA